MSALLERDWDDAATSSDNGQRPSLRAVPRGKPRLARTPFILVLIAVFGLGMTGLLMLNTTLQNQAFRAGTLNRQATELAYAQADLESQVDTLAAPQELARRASAVGLRPNPYPAFLVLPDGKVVGQPRAVTGREVPALVIKSPAQLAAEKAAAPAKQRALAAQRAAKAKADAAAAQARAARQKIEDARVRQAKQVAAGQRVSPQNPATQNPATQSPATQKAAAQKAAAQKAAAQKAAAQKAAAQKAAAQKAAAQKAAAQKAATKKVSDKKNGARG